MSLDYWRRFIELMSKTSKRYYVKHYEHSFEKLWGLGTTRTKIAPTPYIVY